MMEPEIIFERHAAYAEIILNRPEKGNALTIAMIEQLGAIVGEIEKDRDIRAVVIRGRGRFFCTGGDIEAWSALTPYEMGRKWILYGLQVMNRLAALPQPTIAVVSGHALGGGLELAMAADLRIGLKQAKFGAPEVALGIVSGWMGVRRLAELIGVARASHMMLLGTPITAETALDWGLITTLAETAESLEEQWKGWLERLCANAPGSMAVTKGILATMHADLAQHHASAAAELMATDDCKEGVRAFREKRKPVFQNK